MGRVRARRVSAYFILGGLACCTSLDGISGGTDQPDASTESGADATTDAVLTSDAEIDADGGSGDAALESASPCGAAHTFCDDFNRDGSVSAGWTAIAAAAGSATIIDDVGLAAPSLLVNLESDAGNVFLERDVGTALQSIHFETDLNLAQTTTGPEVDLVQIRWLTPPTPCTSLGYYIVRDSTGPVVLQETYQGCGGNVNDSLGNPPGWKHFTLDVTLGMTGHITLKLDGATFVDKDVRELPAAPIQLRLGAGGQALKGTWRVRYDNVLVDLN